MGKYKGILAILITVMVGFAGLGTAGAAVPPPSAYAPGQQAINQLGLSGDIQLIQGWGSDTIYDLMVDLGTIYNGSPGCDLNQEDSAPGWGGLNLRACQPWSGEPVEENWDRDVVVNYFPTGSSDGKRRLCLQDERLANPAILANVPPIDFARSSSSSSGGADCAGTTQKFIALAFDALGWVYDTDEFAGGTTDLSDAELVQIFTGVGTIGGGGCITNWNQVGGANLPMEVWAIQDASGTRATWDSFLGGPTDACTGATGGQKVFENDCAPIEADPTPQGIIWAHSLGPWTLQDGGVECTFGTVNGVAIDPTNPAYPYVRAIYNVIRDAGVAPTATPPTRRFLDTSGWICKSRGLHSNTAFGDFRDVVPETILANGFTPALPPGAFGSRCTSFTI